MGYILSQLAEEDIINIFLSGAERFGTELAERYHARLETTFRFLADNPKAGPIRSEFTPEVRIHPTGSHLIIYRVEIDNEVFVIRVRHAHEDWQTLTLP
jgi:toxin ParE1/3/4